jgi:hypothetical protein
MDVDHRGLVEAQHLQRLREIPQNWKQRRNDPGARAELHAALYRVSEDESGTVVIALLRQGISPEAIWQVLFDTAAELLMHQPGIVPLHAQTTANALYYTYRCCPGSSDPREGGEDR